MAQFQFLPGSDDQTPFFRALSQLESPINRLHVATPHLSPDRIRQLRQQFGSDYDTISEQEWIVDVGGMANPEALEQLRDDIGADVRVTNDANAIFSSIGFGSEHIWAEYDDSHALFVGGGNHTPSGDRTGGFGLLLTGLHPTVHESELQMVRDWWKSMREDAVRYTPERAKEYESFQERNPEWTVPIRGIPPEETPSENQHEASLLWSEVSRVEGGSDNQVDLSQRCFAFFDREIKEREVGYKTRVNLFSDGERYSAVKIRYHENKMCRVNVPLELLDQFDLQGSVIVFHHRGDFDFELTLIPSAVADGYATLLRNYSERLGVVYEMKGGRVCGWA